MNATSSRRGFTTIEALLVMGIMAPLLLICVTSISLRPMEARAAAAQFGAMIDVARSVAETNARSQAVGTNASGATVAVTLEEGRTVVRLYVGRPLVSGNLAEDPRLPPFVTDAKISVGAGVGDQPPFVLLISSSGYASFAAAYKVNAGFPLSISSCPPGGYTLKFSAGMHAEGRRLSCEAASLEQETNN